MVSYLLVIDLLLVYFYILGVVFSIILLLFEFFGDIIFYSFILFVSYLFIILSLFSEFGGGTGWTLYPPLSTSFMSLSPSSLGNLIFGLLISGISSCLTSLNFWTTILNLRSYYLTLKTMPLFP